MEPTTRGDPESPLRWVCKSLRVLADELGNGSLAEPPYGRTTSEVGSLQPASEPQDHRKGAHHPDRNAQFEYINGQSEVAESRTATRPISVDTKKKELVGRLQERWKRMAAEGEPEEVHVHDFIGDLGRANPYGVYDIVDNRLGSVSAMTTTRPSSPSRLSAVGGTRWASTDFPKPGLLITADGGGSNGYRFRLWKFELQDLARRSRHSAYRVSLPTGHQQVEQDRAPSLHLHHAELARQASVQLSDDRQPDCSDHHRQWARGPPPNSTSILRKGTKGKRRGNGSRSTFIPIFPWRMELHHKARLSSANRQLAIDLFCHNPLGEPACPLCQKRCRHL